MKNSTLVIIVLLVLLFGIGLLIYKEYTELPTVIVPKILDSSFNKEAMDKMSEYNLNDFGLFPLKKHLDSSQLGNSDPFRAF